MANEIVSPEFQARRDEILDTAARLFNANGVSQTSLQDLGELMGLTRNALYYYFEDREDLLFQVCMRSCELLGGHLARAKASGGGALDIIHATIRRTLDPAGPELASLNEHGLLGAKRHRALMARYDALASEVAEVVAAGGRTGELRPCDEATVARSIISLLHWIPLGERWATATASEHAAITNMLCDVLARGWETDRGRSPVPPIIDISSLRMGPTDAFDRQAVEDRKREMILSGASRMFNFQGIGATKLEDVAAAFGSSKQQLYRYVGNKRELVEACFARSSHIYGFIITTAMAKGGSAADRLLAILRANALMQQDNELQPLHYATSVGALGAQGRTAARRRQRQYLLDYTRLFEEGFKEKSIRRLDLKVLTQVAAGANTWLVKGFVERDSARKIEMSETVADVLRIGLQAI